MNRRGALAGLASVTGGVVFAAGTARAQPPKSPVPGAIKFDLGREVTIGAHSVPVKVNKTDLYVVATGKGTFRLDKESRLTATIKAAVAQYADVEYWVSVAVFDAAGKLLGTAAHKEVVRYERLGAMPTTVCEMALDFGISKAFKDAVFAVVAISEPHVPKPG